LKFGVDNRFLFVLSFSFANFVIRGFDAWTSICSYFKEGIKK
jgi:hypothetical protein